MARPDATAIAALDAEYIKPAFFAFLDIVGDPLRATTWPANITFAASGDPDLDGHTFHAIRADVVSVSEVRNQEGGSETVTATLSGLILPDNDLLNTINDPANWQGRVGRFWQAIYNENDVRQGAVWHYHTGYMSALKIRGTPNAQVIEMELEGYLASTTQASGRTYLDQEDFDPTDKSAEAAIAVANGMSGNGLANEIGAHGIRDAAGLIARVFGLNYA